MEPLGRPAVEGTGAPSTACLLCPGGDGQSPRAWDLPGLGRAPPEAAPSAAPTCVDSGPASGSSGWLWQAQRGLWLENSGPASQHGFASPLLRFLSASSPPFWSGKLGGGSQAPLGGWGTDRLPRQPPGDRRLMSASPCLGCFPCGAGCCPGTPPPALHFTPGLVKLNIL